MNETFEKKVTVLDEWDTEHDKYRLVNNGAGPDELQVMNDDKWQPESTYYIHSTLTRRITDLAVKSHELADFAIWMTGCGYDFCQHDHFCKQRDKLLKG